MIPYLHLGPITLGTFGIFMWLAFVAAFWALSADLRRRQLPDISDKIILWCAFSGVVGAKLYHVLERPQDLLAHPGVELFSSAGFAWFGGFLGVILTLLLLARHYKLSSLAMLDLCSPAAALGYAVGRIGCLVSGDGDYGIPTSLPWGMSFPNGLVPTTDRVHPTPIYEALVGVAIFLFLWQVGNRAMKQRSPIGRVTAHYLLWTGLARFLVEFIRINPRSFLGMFSNAQAMALASMLAGIVLLVVVSGRAESASPPQKSA